MNKQIKQYHVKEFERIVFELNRLMVDIIKYQPEANIYLESESFNLMNGYSHTDDSEMRSMQENIVTSVVVINSGGGAW